MRPARVLTAALALALAAPILPAQAQAPSVRSLLRGGRCAGATVRLDPTVGLYCARGQRYGALTALPGASFTRASTKTAANRAGQVLSFASGVPAITDLGWLDEAASTNLALQSQAFTNAAWSPVALNSVTDNQTMAPDGTVTAAAVIENTAATTQHRLDQSITFAATPYTFSAFAKPNGRTWVYLRISANGAFFDVQNGVIGFMDTGVTATITRAANGFYRCAVTFTPTAGAAAVRVNLASGNSSLNYTGDGVSGVFLWGAQLEQAAALSSYIPTTGASVTRAADALTLTYAGAPPSASVTYGSGSTAAPSSASPLNLGSSSAGAWVGSYVTKVVVK